MADVATGIAADGCRIGLLEVGDPDPFSTSSSLPKDEELA
jgi:hypothetical protein